MEGATSHTAERPGEDAHGAMGGFTVLMEFPTRHGGETEWTRNQRKKWSAFQKHKQRK